MPRRQSTLYVLGCAAAVMLSGCGGPGGDAGSVTGSVDGVVLMSPMCPVERPGAECRPAPVAGAEVQLLRGGEVMATARTDTQGRFHLAAPAGEFNVHATNPGGYPSEVSQPLEVSPGSVTTVKLVRDSGIR